MTLPGKGTAGATVVCWEQSGFIFPHPCDVLVDAGILLALWDKADLWYVEVNHLWKRHILKPEDQTIPGLWINNYIVGEYVGKSLRKAVAAGYTDSPLVRQMITAPLRAALKGRLLHFLYDSGTESLDFGLAQFEAMLDTGDAFHVSQIHQWSIDFMTVDLNLAGRLENDPLFAGCTVYVPR